MPITFLQPCFKCGRTPNATYEADIFREEKPLQDENLYIMKCPEGHINYMRLQQRRYEILGHIAINAMLDAYNLQAVSAFATSIERCYEWFTYLWFLKKYKDDNLFKDTWKVVSKQSERQLGLFIAAYTSERGEMPPLLDSNTVGFRNSVTHQGKIPSIEETKSFGQRAIDICQNIHFLIESTYRDQLLLAASVEGNYFQSIVPAGEHIALSHHTMCYEVVPEGETRSNIDYILKVYRDRRDRFAGLDSALRTS